jgi:hypothetical protein
MSVALSRRAVLAGISALCVAPRPALANTWVEVMGSAVIHNAQDIDAARRRALADALLSAAFAGGAVVQGHSVMSMARMTSDLLIVRPVGRVLRYEMLGQSQDGQHWQVRIRALVGQPLPGQCADRRRLVLTLYPPDLRVSPNAPAWAEGLAHQIAVEMVHLTGQQPSVAELTLAHGLPQGDPARDATSWRALTQGSGRVPAGGHGLQMQLHIAPQDRGLSLTLRLQLDGPAMEQQVRTHQAAIRVPGPSPLGRAAPLIQPDRDRLARDLGRGAVPALQALLEQAGCQPVRAVIAQDGSGLVVPAGRVHGLTRAALAFTIDRDASVEMLEITSLSERSARIMPLDPTRPAASFVGRPVRFMDTGTGLS